MNFLLAATTLGTWLDTTFASFDLNAFNIFGSIQSDILTSLAHVFTAMGSTPYVVMFGIFGLILCFFKKTRRIGFTVVFTIMIGTIFTNLLLKPLALRIRPYNTLQTVEPYLSYYTGAGMLAESDACFPSGHTTGSMELAMALCLCHFKSKKGYVAWMFPIVGLLTAASRVYLMVHYATDVIGGIIVATIAAVLGFILSGIMCRMIDKHPKADKFFGFEWNFLTKEERMDFDCPEKFYKRYKRKPIISRGMLGLNFFLVWAVIMVVSLFPMIKTVTTEPQRCAYDEEYDCWNAAQTGDRYPAINGEYYCKVHWKEFKNKK